jgi:hypothetical protein
MMITTLDIIIFLSFIQNSSQLYRFVRTSHETYTSPLRARQVNAIYKYVTMVC